MTQKQQPNRKQRRAMAYSLPSQYIANDPVTRAITLRHKKPWQLSRQPRHLQTMASGSRGSRW